MRHRDDIVVEEHVVSGRGRRSLYALSREVQLAFVFEHDLPVPRKLLLHVQGMGIGSAVRDDDYLAMRSRSA